MKQTQQLTKRLTALLLAAMLALCSALPALADGTAGAADGETVVLSTVEDLLALQKRCIVDTDTAGLTVRLDADLDLSGCDFTGLPVFSGHFDGQGHTISGLALDGGSVQGFFRYLEASAVVENLHVQGTAGGTDAAIQGLLAGENRGLVRGCSASGQVTAAQEAGGLVGRNEAGGRIVSCQNDAAVQADRMAGGVAGQNLGSITDCRNDGAVNTALPGAADSLIGIDLSGSDGAALAAVSDTGGITGHSGGVLQNCTNTGAVGYAGVGDNVGGIVGRSAGYLEGCTNSGPVQGSQDVGGVAGQMEPVLSVQYETGRLDGLYSELDALQGEIDTLLTHLDAGGDGVSNALSGLTRDAGDVKGDADALAAQVETTLGVYRQARSDMQAARDAIQDQLDGGIPDLGVLKTSLQTVPLALQAVMDSMEALAAGPALSSAAGEGSDALDGLLDDFDALNASLHGASDTLIDDLQAVNDRLGRVADQVQVLTDATETAEEAVFVDVSREQAGQMLQSRSSGCLVNAANTGAVTGESRVGGIVGSLSGELDTDPAGHWQQQGEGSALSAEVQLRLIVLDSRNSGPVTAKKTEAGGIAGQMDFGYSAGCENTGDVTGSSQVGGIAGRSAGILQGCWARCVLTGSEEVGGIAGYGGEINDCRTVVELLPDEDGQTIRYAGTIAGRVAEDAELAGNRYVHETLGAVDGVTRAAQALPASFETLASDPDAPDGFAQLELTFVADGETVATVPFRYGEGVTSLPAVPQKDGYLGQWPDMDYTCLTYSQTVEAEYTPYASALADGSGETPQVLVDGSFSPQAKVDVAAAEISFTDADGRAHSGTAYTVTVTDPVFGASDCTVHFRKPDTAARYTVWVHQGEGWAEQKPQVDGSYLLIDCPGGQITFVAEETSGNVRLILAAAAVVVVAVAVLAVFQVRRTRRSEPR